MSGVVRTASPCACCEVETCWPGGWRLSLRSFPRLRPLEDQRIPMIKHLLARHRVRHPGSCHHRCELWAVSEQCLVSTFTQQLSSSSSLEESETVVSIQLYQGSRKPQVTSKTPTDRYNQLLFILSVLNMFFWGEESTITWSKEINLHTNY